MSNQDNRRNSQVDLMLKRLWQSFLVNSPALLGLIIILTIRGPLIPGKLPLALGVAGFTGIIIIFKKESPSSLGSIKGQWAVVEGIIFVMICWGSAIYLTLFGLS